MQQSYAPQNQMTNSFRPQYSQVTPTQQPQLGNTQIIGTQSTYPKANQFQFQHEQDPNFRSNSYILRQDQNLKASIPYGKEIDPAQRSASYIPIVSIQIIKKFLQPQKEPMIASIVMDPKDKPLHTLQEFEFGNKQVRQPIPMPQPQIVTAFPERPQTLVYKPESKKKREEYCGLFTKSKPDEYQKGKITQDDNEEKQNEYWLCRIF